jgi:hypothetical protein
MNLRPVLTVVLTLAAGSARAELQCEPVGGGIERCVAGLRSEQAVQFTQSMDQWCWAASMSMVFAQHGYTVSQDTIVRTAWGRIVDLPATPQLMLQGLNREWVDASGRRFRVSGDVSSATPANAAQDLANGEPLIIGTMGHAMMLTALTYLRDPMGNGQVQAAVVRDPWPGRGRRVLSPQEWWSTAFVVRIRVEPVSEGSSTIEAGASADERAPEGCRLQCQGEQRSCANEARETQSSCVRAGVEACDDAQCRIAARRECAEALTEARTSCRDELETCLAACE